jgi:hypothetical protein
MREGGRHWQSGYPIHRPSHSRVLVNPPADPYGSEYTLVGGIHSTGGHRVKGKMKLRREKQGRTITLRFAMGWCGNDHTFSVDPANRDHRKLEACA